MATVSRRFAVSKKCGIGTPVSIGAFAGPGGFLAHVLVVMVVM
jgi:hypothetical protein